MRLSRYPAPLLVLLAALGCGGDGSASPNIVVPEAVARVDVNPSTLSVLVGASGQLTAKTYGPSGTALSGRLVSFSTSDPNVASVSTAGSVTGVSVGSAVITASSEGRSGTATVTVTRPQVASIAVTPPSLTLSVGVSAPLAAVALGAAGDTLPGRTFSWSSSATAIATVSTDGLVTGVAAGAATITVSSEGRSATVSVTVRPASSSAVARVTVSPASMQLAPGATGTLVANALDANDVILAGKAFTFASSSATVATVTGSGLVTAVAEGSATITVTSEGKQATSAVTVLPSNQAPGPVVRIVLSPGQVSMPAKRQDQLTAVAYDSAGRAVPGATYTFVSSNPTVVTVTATGLLNSVNPGTATITASANGKSATSAITVTAGGGGAVARVDVTPATASVGVGATFQLTGTAYDAQGNPTSMETPLWLTDNPIVASVSQSGLVTGLAPGTAHVSMSQGGHVDQATVTVTGTALGNIIDVNPSITYQTITGWSAAAQNGWMECNQTAYPIYKTGLMDRAVNELGLNRVTTALRSGMENTADHHRQFLAGQIDQTAYRDSWFLPVNDNADPMVTDSSKFFFSFIDDNVTHSVLPLRQRLQARGEPLYWTLTYVDFLQNRTSKPFNQMKSAEEFAELVAMAFKHLQKKWGFVPDAVEMLLEPEHTLYNATDMGRALVAVERRLRQHGFTPDFIGPSTTSMFNAAVWYDGMLQVPGTARLLRELAYHRYVAVSYPALSAIGLRRQRDNVNTSMLEHIGSGYDDLYEDLTVGGVSAWMQFSTAFCGMRDNFDADGVYYQINQSDPANPRVNITKHSRLFRQLFLFVRRGAVRLGAASGNSTDLRPLAFRNTNGKVVVVVQAKRGAAFSVRGLPGGTYAINYSTPTGQWNVDLADQTIAAGGTVQTSIPGDGVITIYAK
ncbi:MAG: Ig-like domain-containing protein [Gemmatimonadaceae bacterium]|nr:Ig-like domain-containing protein [Gemmatimonadaceae bacterium]